MAEQDASVDSVAEEYDVRNVNGAETREELRSEVSEHVDGPIYDSPWFGDAVKHMVVNGKVNDILAHRREQLADETKYRTDAPEPAATNYYDYDHQTMYNMVHQDLNPVDLVDAGDMWTNASNAFASIQKELLKAIGSSEAEWEGQGADSARRAVAGLARFTGNSAQSANLAGLSSYNQSDAAQTAKSSMPEVQEFSWDSAIAEAFSQHPSSIGEALTAILEKKQAAEQAHDEAASVMTTLDTNLTEIGSRQPSFPAPRMDTGGDADAAPGPEGSVDVGGTTPPPNVGGGGGLGGYTSGGYTGGGYTAGGYTAGGYTGAAAPAGDVGFSRDIGAALNPGGGGQAGTPGLGGSDYESAFDSGYWQDDGSTSISSWGPSTGLPGMAPLGSGSLPAGRSMSFGSMSSLPGAPSDAGARLGGLSSRFGAGAGAFGTGGAGGRFGGSGATGGRLGSGSMSGTAKPLTQMRAGGSYGAAAAARSGSSTMGRPPMMGGMGGQGQGGEDEDHDNKYVQDEQLFTVEGQDGKLRDPDGNLVVPPVIGE